MGSAAKLIGGHFCYLVELLLVRCSTAVFWSWLSIAAAVALLPWWLKGELLLCIRAVFEDSVFAVGP